MKKAVLNLSIVIVSFILLVFISSCSERELKYDYSEPDTYESTIDFFMHYSVGDKYGSYRFLYDNRSNSVYPVNDDNMKIGNNNAFCINSKNADKIFELSEKLGQLNDYKCFGDIEFALYWHWGGNTNTLVSIKNGELSQIEILATESLIFSYYDSKNGTVYLTDYMRWNEEKTICSGKFYIININDKTVTKELINVYDSELEQKYSISSKLKYPIKDWERGGLTALALIEPVAVVNDTISMRVSFSVYVKQDKNYVNTSFFAKYNINSKKITHLKVIDEIICNFTKTDTGYITFSEQLTLAEDSSDRFVKKIWMSEYDENFELVNTTDIDVSEFKKCNRVIAYALDNTAFIFGQINEDETNVLGVVSLDNNKIKYAKNVPKGFIASDRLIKKQNGKIINLN